MVSILGDNSQAAPGDQIAQRELMQVEGGGSGEHPLRSASYGFSRRAAAHALAAGGPEAGQGASRAGRSGGGRATAAASCWLARAGHVG